MDNKEIKAKALEIRKRPFLLDAVFSLLKENARLRGESL